MIQKLVVEKLVCLKCEGELKLVRELSWPPISLMKCKNCDEEVAI